MRAIGVLIVVLLNLSCAREPPKPEKAPLPVNAATVELYTSSAGDKYSASIAPSKMVNVAFRVNGVVESILQTPGLDGRMRDLQPGDMVQENAVLARLRQKDSQFQVDQANGQIAEVRKSQESARSQLAQLEALATKAQKDLDRANFLWENKSLTRPDLDAARAQYDSSRAQVEATRAQIEAISARITSAEAAAGAAALLQEDTVLRAPGSGTIVQRNIERGGVAGPSVPAFAIADVSSVKALFGIPDVAVTNMRTGLRLSLDVEALPGRRFYGVVSAIAPIADSSTRLFQVEATVANLGRVLRPGMIATLSLAAGPPKPVPVVPLGAIARSPQNATAFAVMVVKGKTVHRRTVTLGETYGDKVAISSGLEAGELVISRGAGSIEDGATVEVIP